MVTAKVLSTKQTVSIESTSLRSLNAD